MKNATELSTGSITTDTKHGKGVKAGAAKGKEGGAHGAQRAHGGGSEGAVRDRGGGGGSSMRDGEGASGTGSPLEARLGTKLGAKLGPALASISSTTGTAVSQGVVTQTNGPQHPSISST